VSGHKSLPRNYVPVMYLDSYYTGILLSSLWRPRSVWNTQPSSYVIIRILGAEVESRAHNEMKNVSYYATVSACLMLLCCMYTEPRTHVELVLLYVSH